MPSNEELGSIFQAVSLPIIRELLTIICKKLNKYNELKDKIESLVSGNEDLIGSFKVDYFNETQKEAYLIFKICSEDHDVMLEFNKVKPYVTDEQWASVLKCVSSMVYILRMMYKGIIKDFELPEEYGELYVDVNTSNLFIIGIRERVGIFVEV